MLRAPRNTANCTAISRRSCKPRPAVALLDPSARGVGEPYVTLAAATRLSILSIAVGSSSWLDSYRDVLAQPPRPQIEATGIEEAAGIISAVLGGDIRVEDALPAKHRGAAAQSRPADFP